VYYPLELLPFGVILVASGLAAVLLLLAPWIFRSTSRKTLRILAFAGAAYFLGMTLFGERIYHFFKGGAP